MNTKPPPLSVKKKNSGVYGVRKQRRITCTIPVIGFVLNVVTVWCYKMSGKECEPEPDWNNEWHLRCKVCGYNPTITLDDNGTEFIICHCTHDDGMLEPVKLEMLFDRPEPWDWVKQGNGEDSKKTENYVQ